MFQTMRNAWKIPELRNKLLFTFLIIILYRLGANIPVPYVSAAAISSGSLVGAGTIFDFVNTLAGGAFANATLFALGVSPYITASIVIQLLTVAIPYFENLAKQGEEGKKIMSRWTRGTTVVLSLITAFGYTFMLEGYLVATKIPAFRTIILVAAYTAGSCLVMWLAEKINEFGIGNGISMILFANIIASFPTLAVQLIAFVFPSVPNFNEFNGWGIPLAIFVLAMVAAMIVGIVWITDSERRIPILYAKRTVGRKQIGGQSSNLPLKLNMTGVMPIIFANAIVSIPATLLALPFLSKWKWLQTLNEILGMGTWLYALVFFLLIIAFAFFYVVISFNPIEVANNIQQQGGQIRGIRPGRPTVEYIQKVLNRVTFLGALFVCAIAVLPMVIYTALQYLPENLLHFQSLFGSFAFLGSSIIIVVGVALETVRELEAQMSLRHYKGFLG